LRCWLFLYQPLHNIKNMSDDIRNNLRSGMIVKVHQKIKETNAKGEEKERIQIFEGMVIAVKHGKEAGATVTVRKISDGVGVEKIFPIHSPVVAKIELVREMRVRQAKPNYIRTYKKKLKEIKRDKAGKTKVEKVENELTHKEMEVEVEPVVEVSTEEKVEEIKK